MTHQKEEFIHIRCFLSLQFLNLQINKNHKYDENKLVLSGLTQNVIASLLWNHMIDKQTLTEPIVLAFIVHYVYVTLTYAI